jgi:hypothetical protein
LDLSLGSLKREGGSSPRKTELLAFTPVLQAAMIQRPSISICLFCVANVEIKYSDGKICMLHIDLNVVGICFCNMEVTYLLLLTSTLARPLRSDICTRISSLCLHILKKQRSPLSGSKFSCRKHCSHCSFPKINGRRIY